MAEVMFHFGTQILKDIQLYFLSIEMPSLEERPPYKESHYTETSMCEEAKTSHVARTPKEINAQITHSPAIQTSQLRLQIL